MPVKARNCFGLRLSFLYKSIVIGNFAFGSLITQQVYCYVVGFPDHDLGIVAFTNSGNGHSIIPQIISEAIGGSHPAIAWLRYEPFDSPTKKIFRNILTAGSNAIVAYKRERANPSTTVVLNEAQVNRLGYWLLGKKRIKEAIEVFKMNVEDFPASWNVYDSLGEAYMVGGEKESAIHNYRKSIELNPNNKNGIEILKKLEGK